jgi:hypothetical protein
MIKQFRVDKLFSSRSGRVTFADLQQLRRTCGFDPAYLQLDVTQDLAAQPFGHVQLTNCT